MTTPNAEKKHFRDPVIIACVIIGVAILARGFAGGFIEDMKNISRMNRENALIYLAYLLGIALAGRLIQNFCCGVVIDYQKRLLSYPLWGLLRKRIRLDSIQTFACETRVSEVQQYEAGPVHGGPSSNLDVSGTRRKAGTKKAYTYVLTLKGDFGQGELWFAQCKVRTRLIEELETRTGITRDPADSEHK